MADVLVRTVRNEGFFALYKGSLFPPPRAENKNTYKQTNITA
jgi:hypothetical protein